MTTRDYINKLEKRGELIRITEPISTKYELAGVLKSLEPSVVLCENVKGSGFSVIGNLFCDKKSFADYLNIQASQIIPRLLEAIQNPSECEVVSSAACQQVVISNPDLDELPIPLHFEDDGGRYLT